MDNITEILSEDFDYEEIPEATSSIEHGMDISGLEDLEIQENDDYEDDAADSREVQGMIGELIRNGYIIDDNMGYYAIKSLYDRLFFTNNLDRTNEFLRKCDELYTTFKDALKSRANYVQNSHMKKQQSYSVIVDSKDTELGAIDSWIRSDLLNKMMAVSFEEFATIDIDPWVEEEYQCVRERYADFTVINSDIERLRRHITRTVKDFVNRNLRIISEMQTESAVNEDCIIKHVCPTYTDRVIKQVFTEDGRYYFLNDKGKHVTLDTPVIHLLSCLGDTKPVICWVPCVFESEGLRYTFASEDYMSFLRTSSGLFKDRSSAKSDCIDLGISITMFMQINDHILFNAPEEIQEEKPFVFNRYSLRVEDAEITEACKKLRKMMKPSPTAFNWQSLARALCVRTNNDYETRLFQAMVGLLQNLDANAYFHKRLTLVPIMQCKCDVIYLQSVTSIDDSVTKIVKNMYLSYINEVRSTIAMEDVQRLITVIEDKCKAYERQRKETLYGLSAYSYKLRYIPISKYESCSLDLLSHYLDELSYDTFLAIANTIVITNIADAFLNGYTYQTKSYMQKNIEKASTTDGLYYIMHNISSKLEMVDFNMPTETLDCMYDQSASDLIRCMHYDDYATVALLVEALLGSVESVTYQAELDFLRDNLATIQNAQSFDELPIKVMLSLLTVTSYIQAQADSNYQGKITINTFADYALQLPTTKAQEWLGIEYPEDEGITLDLQAFYDFQQMKYAREITESTIGIANLIINLVFTDRYDTVDPSSFAELVSAEFYKKGIAYLLNAPNRLGNGGGVSGTDEECALFMQDQAIAQAILEDGGEQAIEAWLSKYLRYMGE